MTAPPRPFSTPFPPPASMYEWVMYFVGISKDNCARVKRDADEVLRAKWCHRGWCSLPFSHQLYEGAGTGV